jgi:hypothetical protein
VKFQPGDLVEATWYNMNSESLETGAAIVIDTLAPPFPYIRVWPVTLQMKRHVPKRYVSSIIMKRQGDNNEV